MTHRSFVENFQRVSVSNPFLQQDFLQRAKGEDIPFTQDYEVDITAWEKMNLHYTSFLRWRRKMNTLWVDKVQYENYQKFGHLHVAKFSLSHL